MTVITWTPLGVAIDVLSPSRKNLHQYLEPQPNSLVFQRLHLLPYPSPSITDSTGMCNLFENVDNVEMHSPSPSATGQLSDQSVTNQSKSPFPGKPSGSHLLSFASTLFQTPFSILSSYNGSLASSIKLSSSIPAQMEHANKHKADDELENGSVISTPMSIISSTASGASGSWKCHTKATTIENITNELSSVNSSITHSNMLLNHIAPLSAKQTKVDVIQSNTIRISNASSTLLILERKLLPEDMVTILDLFQVDVIYADTYLVLT